MRNKDELKNTMGYKELNFASFTLLNWDDSADKKSVGEETSKQPGASSFGYAAHLHFIKASSNAYNIKCSSFQHLMKFLQAIYIFLIRGKLVLQCICSLKRGMD